MTAVAPQRTFIGISRCVESPLLRRRCWLSVLRRSRSPARRLPHPPLPPLLVPLSVLQDGVHYHFTTRERFESEIAEEKFLEHAYVHSNIYGTSIAAVQDVAASGRCCVLDIDVQGARQVRASSLRAIFVFIAPPSVEELERRLRGRGTEAEEQIATRLKNAREELASVEEPGLYDYVLINDDLEACLERMAAVARRALAGEIGGEAVGMVKAAAAAVYLGQSDSLRSWLPGTPVPGAVAVADGDAVAATTEVGGPAPEALSRWLGSVAVVTGAGSGIGYEVARALASVGLRVAAVSRRKAPLEGLQKSVLDAGAPAADFLPVVCDVTKEGEVQALPRIVASRWPGSGIDVLVNCAGVARSDAGLMDGSTAAWVDMLSTNVLGAAAATREAVQSMERRGRWGHVVNVCCLEARAPGAVPGGAFYAATKAALAAMGEGLRREARHRGAPLRVSCVVPGAVEGGGAASEADGGVSAARLQPADVAAAVLWCLAAPRHMDVSEVVVRAVGQAG
jgi:guanylate kinase